MSQIEALLTGPVCEHGGLAGRMPSGEPWCPICRAEQAAAEERARRQAEAERAHLERLRRLGFRRGRPPRDAAMRAAADDSLPD